MTWIVVIGSSLVMIAWIVIYSFFESSDFNDEVTVLFGEVTFWATVLVSVSVALGSCLDIFCESMSTLLIMTSSPTIHDQVFYDFVHAHGQRHRARDVGIRRS
jgi:magnesium-transporting ATPase (P-type)